MLTRFDKGRTEGNDLVLVVKRDIRHSVGEGDTILESAFEKKRAFDGKGYIRELV
jgi:hypothetical protein